MKVDKNLVLQKMNAMGFRDNLKGTAMLRDAIAMWEPGMMLTKEVYPAIGKRHGSTWQAAERAMRFAIEVSAQLGSGTAWNETFGHSVYTAVDAPTTKEFIARMAWMCACED